VGFRRCNKRQANFSLSVQTNSRCRAAVTSSTALPRPRTSVHSCSLRTAPTRQMSSENTAPPPRTNGQAFRPQWCHAPLNRVTRTAARLWRLRFPASEPTAAIISAVAERRLKQTADHLISICAGHLGTGHQREIPPRHYLSSIAWWRTCRAFPSRRMAIMLRSHYPPTCSSRLARSRRLAANWQGGLFSGHQSKHPSSRRWQILDPEFQNAVQTSDLLLGL